MAEPESVVNYFAVPSVGERYARARPAYQTAPIRVIAERLGLTAPLARGLDVGCGTGNSTRALRQIARLVVGSDMSRPMLRSAAPLEGVHYVESLAEELPYLDASFDLVTVASAFHWFDRSRFLPEVRRVLVPGGWLAVYTTGFTGKMLENPAFEQWNRDVYRGRYPSPPRHRRPLDEADASAAGLSFIGQDTYTYTAVLSLDEFADYQTTHSNVIAAIERGEARLEDVRTWLLDSLRPLFRQPTGTFPFEGTITYLQRPVG
jgi:SAM-dependent methyltransferase